jgi:hypothetical protein
LNVNITLFGRFECSKPTPGAAAVLVSMQDQLLSTFGITSAGQTCGCAHCCQRFIPRMSAVCVCVCVCVCAPVCSPFSLPLVPRNMLICCHLLLISFSHSLVLSFSRSLVLFLCVAPKDHPTGFSSYSYGGWNHLQVQVVGVGGYSCLSAADVVFTYGICRYPWGVSGCDLTMLQSGTHLRGSALTCGTLLLFSPLRSGSVCSGDLTPVGPCEYQSGGLLVGCEFVVQSACALSVS